MDGLLRLVVREPPQEQAVQLLVVVRGLFVADEHDEARLALVGLLRRRDGFHVGGRHGERNTEPRPERYFQLFEREGRPFADRVPGVDDASDDGPLGGLEATRFEHGVDVVEAVYVDGDLVFAVGGDRFGGRAAL